MKKYLLAFLIIVLYSNVSYAIDVADPAVDGVQNPIFRSSLTTLMDELDSTSDEYTIIENKNRDIDPNNLPFFKQARLVVQDKYNSLRYGNNSGNAKNSLKFWNKKNKGMREEDGVSESKDVISESVDQEVSSFNPEQTLSLEGAINKEVTEKQLMLDAQTISFDDETGDMTATGRPVLNVPPQNTTVISDKMIYNEDGNIIKAIGNVVVIKDGNPAYSDYLEINMNEETIFMDKIVSKFPLMNLKAENAEQREGMVILNKGSMYSENSSVINIATEMNGPRFQDMIVEKDVESLFFGNPKGNKLNINVKYVEIDAKKNHDVIKLKNIEVSKNGRKFFKWPSFVAYMDKKHEYFESNIPELSSRRKTGMLLGPGFVFSGPFGSIMKVIPALNYKSKFGIGGVVKYINKYNRTEVGYASASNVFFLKGKQILDDDLSLVYAYNSFTDEWFLGGRMPKYIAELQYNKSYMNRNFLAKNMDLTFKHRASFGFMHDDDQNYNGEHYNNSGNMSTTRTRYMAELNQSLYRYRNEEKRTFVEAGVLLQGSAALYGTGDTQFVGRIGPRIRFQYKNWMQDLGYFLTTYDDNSPLPRFDAYRYGRSAVYLKEAIRLNKYLSVGWSGYINLSNDSPGNRLFQENAFIVSIGPDDLKLVFGYDFVRETTIIGLTMAFDPKGTNVNYEKMIIKNPERLGKENEDNEQKVAFAPSKKIENNEQNEHKLFNKNANVKPKVLQYAEVIEIEDPDKERID